MVLFFEKKKAALFFSSLFYLNEEKRIENGMRVYFRFLPFILKMLSLVFIIMALAQPRLVNKKSFQNLKGIHIMVVLDISQSMLIKDMQPENRLETAKLVIKSFIEGRKADRIGLIVFSGESFTKTPLTLDYEILTESLNQVKVDLDIEQGTAIGVALANGVARLKDSDVKSKVIILLTDGENNTGNIDPETSLEIAKRYNIKVYTIGVGKDGMAQVPLQVRNPYTKRTRTVYRAMKTQVNEVLLKKIAEETKGKFFRVKTSLKLKNVFKEIDSLEKATLKDKEFVTYKEFFVLFLKYALAFFLASLFLSFTFLRVNP